MGRHGAAAIPSANLGHAAVGLALVNQTTQRPIATRVELAITRRARRRGLLGRPQLDVGSALVLVPCVAVHTAFMRFPIDVVFVNRHGCAIHMVERMQPWRVAMSAGAYGVIELAAGSLARRDVSVGDRVCLVRTDEGRLNVPVELDKVKQCLQTRAS